MPVCSPHGFALSVELLGAGGSVSSLEELHGCHSHEERRWLPASPPPRQHLLLYYYDFLMRAVGVDVNSYLTVVVIVVSLVTFSIFYLRLGRL